MRPAFYATCCLWMTPWCPLTVPVALIIAVSRIDRFCVGQCNATCCLLRQQKSLSLHSTALIVLKVQQRTTHRHIFTAHCSSVARAHSTRNMDFWRNNNSFAFRVLIFWVVYVTGCYLLLTVSHCNTAARRQNSGFSSQADLTCHKNF